MDRGLMSNEHPKFLDSGDCDEAYIISRVVHVSRITCDIIAGVTFSITFQKGKWERVMCMVYEFSLTKYKNSISLPWRMYLHRSFSMSLHG
jgi:hypothetical protein